MSQVVLLCDLSGSMESQANGGRTRFQALVKAVGELLEQEPEAKVVCFNGKAWVTKDISEESPDGGTNLAEGFRKVQTLNPTHTIVVSDGQPNNADAAIAAARLTPGVISMIYVGPDEDKGAIAFMERLTRVGAGVGVIDDQRHATANLIGSLKHVLALPAPR